MLRPPPISTPFPYTTLFRSHEQDIGLIEEREGELPPEIARRGVGRIASSLHFERQQEFDAASQRALYLASACALGDRGEAPDEPRVTPCAGLLAVDPARRVELL